MVIAFAWGSWVWWGTGWGIVAFAACVLVWALFWDRSPGRRRCAACWYDMKGVGLTCPECGRTARNEAGVRRTRRRWRWVAAGVVTMLFGTQLADQPKREGGGWTRAVPTSVLVFMARPAWDTTGINDAIEQRVHGGWREFVAHWVTLVLVDAEVWSQLGTRNLWPQGRRAEIWVEQIDALDCDFGERTLRIRSVTTPTAEMTRTIVPTRHAAWKLLNGRPDPTGILEARDSSVLVLQARMPGRYIETIEVVVEVRGRVIRRWTRDVELTVGSLDEALRAGAVEVDLAELSAK